MGQLAITYTVIGEVTDDAKLSYSNTEISLDEALKVWEAPLEGVFPTTTQESVPSPMETKLFEAKDIYICKNKVAKPRVFIPVFPGTNCEYDSIRAFEKVGAQAQAFVFRNLSAQDIRDSVELYKKEIAQSQIIMFPGGFSAGDEPEGSAKFLRLYLEMQLLRKKLKNCLVKEMAWCLVSAMAFRHS